MVESIRITEKNNIMDIRKYIYRFGLSFVMASALTMTSCEKDAEVDKAALYLEVTDYTATGYEENVEILIQSDRDWTIVDSTGGSWYTMSQMEGSGDQTIIVELARNLASQRVLNFEVQTFESARLSYKLTQPTMPYEEFLDLTFSTDQIATSESFVDFLDAEPTFAGIGDYISTIVGYGANSTTLINTTNPSGTAYYLGASAGKNIAFSSVGDGMIIKDIYLEDDIDFILAFGLSGSDVTSTIEDGGVKVYYTTSSVDTAPVDFSSWVEVAYSRDHAKAWGLCSGDIDLSGDDNVDAEDRILNLAIVNVAGTNLIDDVRLLGAVGSTVYFEPVAYTLDIIDGGGEINSNDATIPVRYVYPVNEPAIIERGVAYKLATAADSEYKDVAGELDTEESDDSSDERDINFSVQLTELSHSTEYSYYSYLIDANNVRYWDDALSFTTLEYVPESATTSFAESLIKIAANNEIFGETTSYLSDESLIWSAFNNPATSDYSERWHTKIATSATSPAYLKIAPTSTTEAYQVLPFVNVRDAVDQSLYLCYEKMSGSAFSPNAKLEVVYSTDYAGIYSEATWTVIEDISLSATDYLAFAKVDLSSMGTLDWALMALRYTGYSDEYNLFSLTFGETHKVVYGIPTIEGVMQQRVANSDVVLSIPYRYGAGSAVDVSVECSDTNVTAVLQDTNHAVGNGDYTESINFSLTGTPSVAGDVTFTITYNDTTGSTGTVTDLKAQVYAIDGTLSLLSTTMALSSNYTCTTAANSGTGVGTVAFTDSDITISSVPYVTTLPMYTNQLLALGFQVRNLDGVLPTACSECYWTFAIPITTEVKAGASIYFDTDFWVTQPLLDYTIHNLQIYYSTDNATWNNDNVASSNSKDPADDGKNYIPVGHRTTAGGIALTAAACTEELYQAEHSPITFNIAIEETLELSYGDTLYIRMYVTCPSYKAVTNYGFARDLTIAVVNEDMATGGVSTGASSNESTTTGTGGGFVQ